MAHRRDNFNRANSTTALGTPSDGGSAWVAGAGTWGITTNRAYSVTATDTDVAYLETNSANVEVQVTIETQDDAPGITARLSDSSNYILWDFDGVFGGAYDLWKNVAGSFTSLGAWPSGSGSGPGTQNGKVIKLRVEDDDTISGYVDGVLRVSTTDSFNNTETKCGLWTYTTGGGAGVDIFDDFSVVDLDARAIPPPRRRTRFFRQKR